MHAGYLTASRCNSGAAAVTAQPLRSDVALLQQQLWRLEPIAGTASTTLRVPIRIQVRGRKVQR